MSLLCKKLRRWCVRFRSETGEPLFNLEGTLRAVMEIKRRADVPVRINTNGHALLIYPGRDVPRELLDAGVERIQGSLNAQDEETYGILCRPQLKEAVYHSVLEFSKRCTEIMELEISAVELPGVDLDRIEKFARIIGARFRIRNYHGSYSMKQRFANLLSGGGDRM
jgi:cyclic pyranopterin phosphate synthase